jgi:hypothetical protein
VFSVKEDYPKRYTIRINKYATITGVYDYELARFTFISPESSNGLSWQVPAGVYGGEAFPVLALYLLCLLTIYLFETEPIDL